MKIQETKTKNRTGICRIFLYTFIVLGAVLIFTAPFWHIGLPNETMEITAFRKKAQSKEEALSAKIDDLRAKYDSRRIAAEEFISLSDSNYKGLEELKEENDIIISKAIDEQRIFSWKSPRAFLLGLGVRLPYVLFSLVISLLIISRKNDPKHLKSAFLFLQVACWSISVYWMIWVFWDFQDYSLRTYRYAFISASILIGMACSYFLSNYHYSIAILKSKIRYIMNLMAKQAVDKGHIKDEERYDDEIVYPALRKLDE